MAKIALTAAYGLCVELDLPVPALDGPEVLPAGPPLRVALARREEIEGVWSGGLDPPRLACATVDGIVWRLEHGLRGDARVTHGENRLHIDAGATRMLCAPGDPASLAWQRVLLDTALVTASLARGFDALHAGAVALDRGCVVILGARGAGKTTLTLELVRRGAQLVADDILALARERDGSVMAHLAPPVANMPASMTLDGIAELLHDFGDERWVRIERVAARPQPLHAVVVIDRREDAGDARLATVREPAVTLLSHALHSGGDPRRRSRRFSLLADVAATAPVLRLEAAADAPPALLADLVMEGVLT